MKKNIFTIFILFSINALAQSGIEYTFPNSVTDSITAFLKTDKCKKHYIVLDKTSADKYRITIIKVSKSENSEFQNNLMSTNRFVRIKKKSIPIIFQMDADFLSMGKGIHGGIIRSAVIYHGFTISFSYSGEILKE
jgi:hypothetical protein